MFGMRYYSRSCANTSRRGSNYGKQAMLNQSRRLFDILHKSFDFSFCMVEGCTYRTTFNIHRLVTGKNGGKYEIGNMFAICPNHHAEVTRGLIHFGKVNNSQIRII